MNDLQQAQLHTLPRFLQRNIEDYLRLPPSKRDESDRISIINKIRAFSGDFNKITKPAYQ